MLRAGYPGRTEGRTGAAGGPLRAYAPKEGGGRRTSGGATSSGGAALELYGYEGARVLEVSASGL